MAEDAGSEDAGNPENTGSWLDDVKDEDTKTWAESKGLQNGTVENVLGSYRNLEKLMGADKAGRTVTLLGDDPTPEQRTEFYSRLGMPKEAKEYGLAPPEGQDGKFAEWASGVFHEAGLNAIQAKQIAEAWETHRTAIETEAADTETTTANDAVAALKKEWGAAYDRKVNGIDVAAEKLGFSKTQLDGLRSAMGPVEAMKFVDTLNSKMGDHNFDYGESVINNQKTPEQARIELRELSMNKEFTEAWLDKQHPGHKAAIEKKAALSRQAAGIVG